MKRIWIPMALAIAVVGCAALNRTLPTPQEMGAAEDPAALERGRTLLVQQCIACHRMYWPEEYPPGAWAAIAPEMGSRAGLSAVQTRDLSYYLVTASKYVRTRQEPDSSEAVKQ